jgi:hemerythrin
MQHDLARDRATAMLHDVEAGSVEAARVFLEFVAKWFRDHMAVSDRMMGAHLRNYERCRAIAS